MHYQTGHTVWEIHDYAGERPTKTVPEVRELSYRDRIAASDLPPLVDIKDGRYNYNLQFFTIYNADIKHFFEINRERSTRVGEEGLSKKRVREYVKKYLFSNTEVEEWNKIGKVIVNAENLVKNKKCIANISWLLRMLRLL